MNFTCFLNSRGRPQQLLRCIESLEKTTYHQGAVELIITADEDDIDTLNFLNTLPNRKSINFRTIIGERPKNLCVSYNNMARQARGQYLLVLNDDAEMQTRNWDVIALEKILDFKAEKSIKDDIIYGETSDTSVDKPAGKSYASFPIISRQAVKSLGFFMHEQYVGLGGDSCIERVYRGVGRIVPMREIVLDHIYHNTIDRVISPDLTAHEMRINTAKNPVDPFGFDVSEDVEKLKTFIWRFDK